MHNIALYSVRAYCPNIRTVLIGIVLKAHIVTNFTYKQFCGVSAMVERLMCQEFSTSNRNNYKLCLQNFRPRAQGQ